MEQVGFIRSKQEIKYLILYIAERLIAPVPIEGIQELTMCDPAVSFFDFSECLSYLVDTGHMTCSEDGLYAITAKGVQNGRACAQELPYSVRRNAEQLTEAYNQRIKRQKQVQSFITPGKSGTFHVALCFNDDEGGTLWHLEINVPQEAEAKALVKRFQKSPEKLYSEITELLFRKSED
ncbi:MAG: DUF4364 family protein [Ruminococcaceae bacterium]|jgi:hypothetical protein|nr:DUF4364 family protein [Oscillospiraceae bacterium]